MGAPIAGFVAATNANHTVPDWIATGDYNARPSIATLSNAMDVGAPSNYERISYMYTLEEVRSIFASYWTDDKGTKEGIEKCYEKTGYIIDPHGAVAWKAWDDIKNGEMEKLMKGEGNTDINVPGLTANIPSWAEHIASKNAVGIILETAHPAKFGSTVTAAIGREPSMPDRLEKVLSLPDRAQKMEKDYESFKEWLCSNL